MGLAFTTNEVILFGGNVTPFVSTVLETWMSVPSTKGALICSPFMVTVLWGRSIIALQASKKSKPKINLSSIRVTQTSHFVVIFHYSYSYTIRPATGWLSIPVSCTTSQLACKFGNRDSSAKVSIAAVSTMAGTSVLQIFVATTRLLRLLSLLKCFRVLIIFGLTRAYWPDPFMFKSFISGADGVPCPAYDILWKGI